MTFALQLRTLRTFRNISQAELEQQSGVPKNLLSLIETGKILPGPEMEGRIKAALNWPPDEVFNLLTGSHPAESSQ